MNKPLECILLIDDDEPTNVLHKIIIEDSGIAKEVAIVYNGFEGIDYLTRQGKYAEGDHPRPDLIFLDINMPGMNGFEFLERYKKLDENQKARMVVVMLTTSLNPEDRERAHQLGEISDFKNKPLTAHSLNEIVEANFKS